LPNSARVGSAGDSLSCQDKSLVPEDVCVCPNEGRSGVWGSAGFRVVDALAEKLSLGAWGGMPYSERVRRCKALARERKGGFGR
jgi:hypothetical protein